MIDSFEQLFGFRLSRFPIRSGMQLYLSRTRAESDDFRFVFLNRQPVFGTKLHAFLDKAVATGPEANVGFSVYASLFEIHNAEVVTTDTMTDNVTLPNPSLTKEAISCYVAETVKGPSLNDDQAETTNNTAEGVTSPADTPVPGLHTESAPDPVPPLNASDRSEDYIQSDTAMAPGRDPTSNAAHKKTAGKLENLEANPLCSMPLPTPECLLECSGAVDIAGQLPATKDRVPSSDVLEEIGVSDACAEPRKPPQNFKGKKRPNIYYGAEKAMLEATPFRPRTNRTRPIFFNRTADAGSSRTPLASFDELAPKTNALADHQLPLIRQSTVQLVLDDLRNTKVIGQLDKKFIVCAVPAQASTYLIVFDQHAVHERIRLEALQQGGKDGQCGAYDAVVLKPPVNLDSCAQSRLKAISLYKRHLAFYGFCFGEKGSQLDLVTAPRCLMEAARDSDDRCNFIRRVLLECLKDVEYLGCVAASSIPALHNLCATVACKGAITFNTTLNKDEMASLVADLSKCKQPFSCAHGRPSVAPLVCIQDDFFR